jgi:hypothetical protein
LKNLQVGVTFSRVTPTEALEQIRGYARANRYRIHPHAWDRLRGIGRNVYTSEEDVLHALQNAKQARFQPHNERWRVEGPDMDGDDLTMSVVIEDGLLVITVM